MKKNKIILFLLINILFSQAEYQILTIPKNTFQLSANGGLAAIVNTYNYMNPSTLNIQNNHIGFSLIRYPADINIYNFNLRNYSLSILDYGSLQDKLHDVVNKTFSAQEVMFQYFYNYDVRNLKLGISAGAFYSHIHHYNSFGISSSIGISAYYKKIKSSIGLSIENLGYVLKSFTTYNNPIPLVYRFSFHKRLSSFLIGYDAKYLKESDDIQHILCLEFMASEKINFRISNSSYLADLLVDENDYNFLSGLGMGINIKLKGIALDIGFMNLGIAGAAYGMSLSFLRK